MRDQQEPNNPFGSRDVTINDLLSAISETEYPQYILDALTLIQDWMQETLGVSSSNAPGTGSVVKTYPTFPNAFEVNNDEMAAQTDVLFERLESLDTEADIIPSTSPPNGNSDAIIVNLTPLDYESGLRTAIDYAALFNRSNSKRVWIVSDSFVFEDVIRYSAHVDALTEQGVSLRFILVTPWGWVEMPLSGRTVSRQHFLWQPHLRGTGQNK